MRFKTKLDKVCAYKANPFFLGEGTGAFCGVLGGFDMSFYFRTRLIGNLTPRGVSIFREPAADPPVDRTFENSIQKPQKERISMMQSHVEEMTRLVVEKTGANADLVREALVLYWQDKIAHIWCIDDVLAQAGRDLIPLTRGQAGEILENVYDRVDCSVGISWTTLQVYILELDKPLSLVPPEEWGDVFGTFRIWREKDDPATDTVIGDPYTVESGNFPIAIEAAKELSARSPGESVFVAVADEKDPGQCPRLYTWMYPCAIVSLQDDNAAINFNNVAQIPADQDKQPCLTSALS